MSARDVRLKKFVKVVHFAARSITYLRSKSQCNTHL